MLPNFKFVLLINISDGPDLQFTDTTGVPMHIASDSALGNPSDNDDKTYTRYICIEDLKKLDYYTEELKFSNTACEGAVVYLIDEETDIQKESYSLVKCKNKYINEKIRKLQQKKI